MGIRARQRFSTVRRLLGASVGVALLLGSGALVPASAVSGEVNPPQLPAPICPGYSGQHTNNSYQDVRFSGLFRANTSFASVKVISGLSSSLSATPAQPTPVSITWGANPYSDVSWQSWFHSLKWAGSLLYVAGGRTIPDSSAKGYHVPSTAERWDAANLALGIAKHYLDTYPSVASAPNAAQRSSFGHRSQLLACLVEAVGLQNAPLWLIDAARAHANWLSQKANYLGAWNQGMDQDLGVLATGCVIGERAYSDLARNRLSTSIGQAIGPDGVPLEQATGYADYQYTLWVRVLKTYQACGLPTDDTVSTRIAAVPGFLAQATQPDGRLVQLGDTFDKPVPLRPGTEYPQSLGKTGTAPSARVAIYSPSGFIFGRNTWSPFTTASFYSLRFGPARTLHGHSDKTSLTWMVGGADRLVDSGHVGYSNTAVRDYLRAPYAHNLLSPDEYVGFRPAAYPSRLLASSTSQAADSFLVDAKAFAYKSVVNGATTTVTTNQLRGVLIARSPDLLVVRDSGGGAPKSSVVWRQHWHLPPGWTAKTLSTHRVEATSGTKKTTLVRIPLTTGMASPKLVSTPQATDQNVVKYGVDVQFPATGRSTAMLTVIAPVASTALKATLSSGVLTIVSGSTTVKIRINANGSLTRL